MMTLTVQAAEIAALPTTASSHAASRRYAASRLRDGALDCCELAGAVLQAYGKDGQVAHDRILWAAADLMRLRREITTQGGRP